MLLNSSNSKLLQHRGDEAGSVILSDLPCCTRKGVRTFQHESNGNIARRMAKSKSDTNDKDNQQ